MKFLEKWVGFHISKNIFKVCPLQITALQCAELILKGIRKFSTTMLFNFLLRLRRFVIMILTPIITITNCSIVITAPSYMHWWQNQLHSITIAPYTPRPKKFQFSFSNKMCALYSWVVASWNWFFESTHALRIPDVVRRTVYARSNGRKD